MTKSATNVILKKTHNPCLGGQSSENHRCSAHVNLFASLVEAQ